MSLHGADARGGPASRIVDVKSVFEMEEKPHFFAIVSHVLFTGQTKISTHTVSCSSEQKRCVGFIRASERT